MKISKSRQISQCRQKTLRADIPVVQRLYQAACDRFGAAAVAQDLTLLWTLRCMWGVQNIVPFGATKSTSLRELLFVARELCGYRAKEETPDA